MTPAQLAERRRALGLSQVKLARLLDVDPMTVSRWERGSHPMPSERLERQLLTIEQLAALRAPAAN